MHDEDPATDVDAIELAMQHLGDQDTEANRTALFTLLLDASLFVATSRVPSRKGTRITEADEQLSFSVSRTEEGTVLRVFTDVAHFAKAHPKEWYIGLDARVLFELAQTNGVTRIELNPGTLPCGWISRREIEILAKGHVPVGSEEVVPRGTGITVSRVTAEIPDHLIATVRTAVAEAGAEEAWLFLVQSGARTPELAVGVVLADRLDDVQRNEAMRAVRDNVEVGSATGLVFLVVTPDLRTMLSRGAGDLIFERRG
jgi:hypothetical protein